MVSSDRWNERSMATLDPLNPRTRGLEKRLNQVYRRLSIALEEIDERLMSPSLSPSERVCLTVLDDDTRVLLEECEEMIVTPVTPSRDHLRSFESRAACVMEELKSFVRPPPPRHPFSLRPPRSLAHQ